MIGNGFTFKGINLMHSESDFRIGIKSVERRKISASYDRTPYVYRHWVIASNAYARGRAITVEGYIIASTRAKTSKGMDRLDSLFTLAGYPGELDLQPFVITDEQSRIWTIDCVVAEPLDYDIEEDVDHTDWSFRRFRVWLFAPDPRLYSTTTSTIVWEEGSLGGIAIWEDGFAIGELWVALDAFLNEIIIVWLGGSNEPVRITITAQETISNREITLYDVTKGKFFIVETSMATGQELVIDSINSTLTLDGVNIIWSRLPGSVRPSVLWLTYFVLYDTDDVDDVSQYVVEVEYTQSLL